MNKPKIRMNMCSEESNNRRTLFSLISSFQIVTCNKKSVDTAIKVNLTA